MKLIHMDNGAIEFWHAAFNSPVPRARKQATDTKDEDNEDVERNYAEEKLAVSKLKVRLGRVDRERDNGQGHEHNPY